MENNHENNRNGGSRGGGAPCYKILFNSKNGENQMTSINTETNSVYFPFVHWDKMLPQGKYKLTWTYTGASNIIKQNNIPKLRFIGFKNDNTYNTTQNNGAEANTLDLGTLKTEYVMDADGNAATNVSFLTASLDDNEPIYLDSRPHNGALTIQILNELNQLWYDDMGTAVGGFARGGIANYNLTDMNTQMRVNIGTIIWWNSANSKFTKIVDYNDSFGIYSPTYYSYKTNGSGFATSGIGMRVDPSNPPGHYILQLHFELLS